MPSSARDEDRDAVDDGLCSYQFLELCSTAAETKLHFAWRTYILKTSHNHDGTETLLLLRYRKIDSIFTSLKLSLALNWYGIELHVTLIKLKKKKIQVVN